MTGFIVPKQPFYSLLFYFINDKNFNLKIVRDQGTLSLENLLKLIGKICLLVWIRCNISFIFYACFVFHNYPFCLQKVSISIWIVTQRADRLRILIELIWQASFFLFPSSPLPPFIFSFFASNQAAVIKARIKELIFHYTDACWTEPCFAFLSAMLIGLKGNIYFIIANEEFIKL